MSDTMTRHQQVRPLERAGWAVVALLALVVALLVARGGNPATASSGPQITPLAATAKAVTAKAGEVTVNIKGYAYDQPELKVTPGTKVTWINQDEAPHTVTGTSGPVKLKSPTLQKGDSWSFTFEQVGDYEYYCAVHPDMTAGVTVAGGSTAPAPAPTPTTPAPADPGHGGGGHGGMPMPSEPAEPSTPAEPGTPSAPVPADPGGECSTGLAEGVLEPFMTHVSAAHLQTSPGQQVADLMNVDDYVKAHTVLVDSMLTPATAVAMAGTQAVDPLMTHVQAAHLQTSPGQQVADLMNVDDYVKAHTVLVDSMISPAGSAATGGGC